MPSPSKAEKARREAIKADLARAAAANANANPLASASATVEEPIERAAGQYDNPPPPSVDGEIAMLGYWQIVPDPNNPRRDFDPEEINLLADSIREHGLMQNLVAAMPTRLPDCPFWVHVLISGERRWRAIGQLVATGEWPRNRLIPVRIVALADEGERAIRALVENLVRRDLKPLEEAHAFAALRDQHGVKTDDIAARINRSQRMVQQRLQLLDLSAADQAALEAGQITIEDARRRLSSRVPPIELTVAEEIVLAELLHAREAAMAEANATGGEFSGDLFVGAEARTDPARVSLCDKGLINGPYSEHRLGVATGRQTIGRGYRLGSAKFARPLPTASMPYATRWLNGPFAITAEQQAAIDAELATRNQERRERIAAETREDAAWAARRADAARLREMGPFAEALPGAVAAALADIDRRLPWTCDPDGALVNADGETFLYAGGERNVMLLSLIAVAVNAAAGMVTPATLNREDPWEPEQDIDGNDPAADDDDENEGDAWPKLSEIVADLDAKEAAE